MITCNFFINYYNFIKMKSLIIVKILTLFKLTLNLIAQESTNTKNLPTEKISIPFLEEFNIKKDPGKYFDSVYKFINENPESKYIPRICYDFYLAALDNSNVDLIKKGKALLFIAANIFHLFRMPLVLEI